MSLTKLALSLAAPLPKLEGFERFLFVGPHPDDIEIGAGATAAKLAAKGKDVRFVICCDGRYGLDHAPKGTSSEELIDIRKEEARASAKMLGAREPVFLELCDGGFYSGEELFSSLARIIGEIQPEILFAPDPCVSSECHADHLNVGEAVRRLAFLAPFPEIMTRYGARSAPVQGVAYYMTAKPTQYIGVQGFTEKQREAILCHESQFPRNSAAWKSVSLYLKLRNLDFGLRSGKNKAEGFRVLGQTQMHCLPEAGR